MNTIKVHVPNSLLKKKAEELNIDKQFLTSWHQKKYPTFSLNDAINWANKILNPTEQQQKEDEEYLEKLKSNGINIEDIYNHLSLMSPFKEFIDVNNKIN